MDHPVPIALGGSPPSPPGRAGKALQFSLRHRVLSRPAPDPLRARSHKRRDASRVRHVREPLEGCYRPRKRRRVTRRARRAGRTKRRAEPFADGQQSHLMLVVGALAGVEVEQPHQAEHVTQSGPAIRHPGEGGTPRRRGGGGPAGKVGALRVLGYVGHPPG